MKPGGKARDGGPKRRVTQRLATLLAERAHRWIAASTDNVSKSVAEANKHSPDAIAKFGQFFDPDDNAVPQVGIYGTAYAAAMLRPNTANEDLRDLFSRLGRALPGWDGANQDSIRSEDLALTLKYAALLSAAPWQTSGGPGDAKLGTYLAEMLLRTQGSEESLAGWGYYSPAITIKAQRARVFPTAHLVFSALQHGDLELSRRIEWRVPVMWIVKRVEADASLTDLESAMVLLALKSSLTLSAFNDGEMASIKSAIDKVTGHLIEVAEAVRSTEVVGYYAHVQYPAPDLVRSPPRSAAVDLVDFSRSEKPAVESETHKYRYMFYPIHALIALALVWMPPGASPYSLTDSARRYVYSVVDDLLIRTEGGATFFAASATERMSVSDTYWIYLLMQAVTDIHRVDRFALVTRLSRVTSDWRFLFVLGLALLIFSFVVALVVSGDLGAAITTVVIAGILECVYALIGTAARRRGR